MDKIEGESSWVEAYRPKRIADCILTEEHKNTFLPWLQKKRFRI